MDKRILNRVCLVLAAAGLCLALFLTFEHKKMESSGFCSNGGCGSVMNSQYSHVGPVPTAALGALMYLIMALLCVARERLLAREADRAGAPAAAAATAEDAESPEEGGLSAKSAVSRPESEAVATLRRLDLAIWSLALAAFFVSWALQYTALFVVQSFCPYCFTSACLVTLIFILSSVPAWLPDAACFDRHRLKLTVGAALLLYFGTRALPQIAEQWHRIHAPSTPRIETAQSGGLEETKRTVLGDSLHSKGNPNAKVVLVEFADYECGGCRTVAPVLDRLAREHARNIRLVFRNFPIESHVWGVRAAQAAEAAGAQGKFWQMHDLLYAHQADMDQSDFKQDRFVDWARSLGLDTKQFKEDLDSNRFAGRVNEDAEDGRRDGINRTPAFRLITKLGVWKADGVENLKELQQRVEFEAKHAEHAH
jgi:protein-disulfide isomerase/uncharacterized membrane protein